MPTQRKNDQVADLEDRLKRSTITIAAQFRGVTVADMATARRQFRQAGLEFLVVKNTLATLAGERAGKPEVARILDGPTALAFGYGEPVEPAKVVTEHIRASRVAMTVLGAILDGQAYNGAQVMDLAATPPKPVLIARVLGGLLSPLYGLAQGLQFHTAGLARVLEARLKQMEEAGA